MHVDAYTETLRRTLVETSSLGDDRTQDVARSLAAALDPALRLVALQMLTDTADELNGELDGAHVAVVMDGATPHLLVTQADRSDDREQDHVTGPDCHAQTPVQAVSEVAEGPEVRTTLRLPESLKQQIDAAARGQGRSVNAWLVEAARGALSEQSFTSGSQRPPSTGNDGAGPDRSASGSDGGRPTDWRARPAQRRTSGATLSGWFG
ncbi:CopG family transcriptional regulator [Actinomyces oris]|uniref:CopG family transcriptional regulator n=1 Tax=Actinomyces oris TaxID=544580 RepID=UPI0028D08B05|nr:CopG family transcriptional regulator [Actinomyces oris]